MGVGGAPASVKFNDLQSIAPDVDGARDPEVSVDGPKARTRLRPRMRRWRPGIGIITFV